MTAEQFDAYTRGKTFYFNQSGAPYGAEKYLENRRVRWSFLDGECKNGEWYEKGETICFIYEDLPDPQCWIFTKTVRGMTAQFEDRTGAKDQTGLYEANKSRKPLLCLGPEVGV